MSLGETASSADLGGSSNYSNENFEGRSGEGFRENRQLVTGDSILRHGGNPC